MMRNRLLFRLAVIGLGILCSPVVLAQMEPGAAAVLMPTRDSIPIRSVKVTAGAIQIETAEGELSYQLPKPPAGKIVALSQDGVIRCYLAGTPMKERLALLVLGRDRYVAWTPSGYFESVGQDADTAIGVWSELADGRRHFFPAREFSRDYQRPDIVRLALSVTNDALASAGPNRPLGSGVAARPLGAALPAIGQVAAPSEGTLLDGRSAEVTLELFAPTAVSSRSSSEERGLKITGVPGRRMPEGMVSWKERIQVALPAPPTKGSATPDVTIPVPTQSLPGRPVPLRLTWDRGWRVALPDLYLLTIGVNDYRQSEVFSTLRFAAKDAQEVAKSLLTQQGQRYRHVFSQTLTNQQATLPEVRAKLAWLQEAPQEHDVVIIFFAGHGVAQGVGKAQRYYFVPSDADVERLSETALSDEQLYRSLTRFRASTVVLFIDTCRAGSTPAQRRLMEELQTGSGIVVYSATKANRPSLERASWGNGAFTKALLEGLAGGANIKGDGRITASGLENFISRRVKVLTEGEQEPVTVRTTTDLWLAQSKPALYRRWWTWGLAGVATLGAIAGVAAGVLLSQSHSNLPSGPNIITF